MTQVLSNTAGTTIGTSPYSDSLKRRRKGAASALNRPSIQTYIPHLDLESKDFVSELLRYGKAGAEAVDPMPMIQRLSLSLALTLNWGVRMDSQHDALFDEITHVEEEISRFRSTTGNLQDYIPLLRLNPFGFGSKKAGMMRDRRDVYLKALNKGLEDRRTRVHRRSDGRRRERDAGRGGEGRGGAEEGLEELVEAGDLGVVIVRDIAGMGIDDG